MIVGRSVSVVVNAAVAVEEAAREAADVVLSAEIDTDVAAEATARAEAIGTHSGLAAAHHTKFTNTEHDVVARHPLANLNAAVCSETEADNKIAAALDAIFGATLYDFQLNPATGTFLAQTENTNDNDTGTGCRGDTPGQYAEIDFGKRVSVDQWRIYGADANVEDGVWKIEYFGLDSAWHDWVTGIPTNKAVWTIMASETEVYCTKIRLTVVSVDSGVSDSAVNELEVYHS